MSYVRRHTPSSEWPWVLAMLPIGGVLLAVAAGRRLLEALDRRLHRVGEVEAEDLRASWKLALSGTATNAQIDALPDEED